MSKEKFINAHAKVLALNEAGYVLGFECPRCDSGFITKQYSHTGDPLKVGDIIPIKIASITMVDDTVTDINILNETPKPSFMPDLVSEARDIGILDETYKDEKLAVWTRAFINDLPNSSFAAVEECYTGGDTTNKNARHLPFKDASGKVDMPHLRNALARLNQITPICSSSSKEELISKARGVLEAAAKRAGIGRFRVRESLGNKVYKIEDTLDNKTNIGISEKELEIDTLADTDQFARIAEEHPMANYSLIHHWWEGGKFEHWDLFINDGEQTNHFVFANNPLKATEIKAARRQPYSNDFWLRGEKEEIIDPGMPGNPSNLRDCHILRLDSGKVAVYESALQQDESYLLRVEFFGKALEGRWSLTSSVPNIWHALKETVKLSSDFPVDIQLSGQIKWEETPDGLKIFGTALSFGVWNNFFWSPDVIQKSPLNDFDSMIIDVEHENDKPVGAVLKKTLDGYDVKVEGLIKDYETIEKIKRGDYQGFSIDATVFADPTRRMVTSVKSYKRLTVCKNPACRTCYFGM